MPRIARDRYSHLAAGGYQLPNDKRCLRLFWHIQNSSSVQRNQLGMGDEMAYSIPRFGSFLLAACLLLLILPSPVTAFGAGNIPSIAQVEGKNFRHGGTVLFDL